MATIKASAPAKLNLTLHVTGQRSDGYHLLDSLVGFVGIYDELSATVATDLQIEVSGPFAQGIPTNDRNIVMRAAQTLRRVRNVTKGAHITLEKHLPHAAGIGSGSSDAALALAMLAELWEVPPLVPTAAEVLTLGADVPVCLHAPSPVRMTGIGETLLSVPPLPDCAVVLVNPQVEVPTGGIFEALANKRNPAMGDVPKGLTYTSLCDWLGAQRNDLLAPALSIAPDVSEALLALKRMPLVGHVGMSGSGATCFGVVRNMADARQVARALQVGHMGWWVAPGELL